MINGGWKMRKHLFCILLCMALSALFPAFAEDYRNPMALPGQYPPISGAPDDYGIGDPFVMRFNGVYYLYASSCEERVRVFTSRNLVDWEFRGWCTENRDVYFAYAPEVVYWRGSFYMVTSPSGGGHYILKSDSPLGPFRLVTGNFGYQIDGSFFVEDDGQLLLLFPEDSQIKQTYLNPETMLPKGIKYSTGATLKHWTEGPGLFRRGEWYYLTFTGNHLLSSGYRVAYASRLGSAVGKFDQPAGGALLIRSVFGDPFTGLGHSSTFYGPDLESLYTAYHSFVSVGGPARLYNLDRLLTNGGKLYTTGPTDFPMPRPALPDVYGDAAGDLNGFSETEAGFFADIPATDVFTQECSFSVRKGACAVWQAGRCAEGNVLLKTDGKTLALLAGDQELCATLIPDLGEEGRLHTLRVECTEEIFYASIDGMRLITRARPGFTADRIGAYKAEGLAYSFMACTAKALGSGDAEALKVIPGRFSAVHALNGRELETAEYGKQMERAAVLGRADYAVRVAAEGRYRFDFTVSAQDAGKPYAILLDGEPLLAGVIPDFSGKADFFTFTSEAVPLADGDHTLTLTGGGITVLDVSSFAYEEAPAVSLDFSEKKQRTAFLTLGAFTMNAEQGSLHIRQGRAGYALFGGEGNTDYEMRVRFTPPVNGSGTSGVMVRASNVSLYEAQVKESFYGYGIILSRLGVNLQKMSYGSQGLGFFPVDAWKTAETAEVVVTVRGNRLTVGLPGQEPLFTLEDAQPFTHGLCGFFGTGKELTVDACEIIPLD